MCNVSEIVCRHVQYSEMCVQWLWENVQVIRSEGKSKYREGDALCIGNQFTSTPLVVSYVKYDIFSPHFASLTLANYMPWCLTFFV